MLLAGGVLSLAIAFFSGLTLSSLPSPRSSSIARSRSTILFFLSTGVIFSISDLFMTAIMNTSNPWRGRSRPLHVGRRLDDLREHDRFHLLVREHCPWRNDPYENADDTRAGVRAYVLAADEPRRLSGLRYVAGDD